ncbi:TFIID-18kDa-domain-containing protein [Nadsonia fulvescens var. elongata DSM 6958]|uniref:TFIID-18kDa-domain-containing protein n=1 Tax=Nadsonia fulvescens var. elongata DSM 6958 TaxID=857566 RepID=A0A1E3PM89_9ASCO|nr:TFIID-18kDa-domain-containing protein [Nadsonia fulvescens var. elongata DSM 6958]
MSGDKYKYRMEIQQMMFVNGETNDPPSETTALVEDIVRSQVSEILLRATIQAQKRNSRSITSEDLIFLIRHDKAKVNRLRTYLSWKDVRKNAKDQEGGGVEGTDILEDTAVSDEAKKMYKKSKIRLPWEMVFMFPEQSLDENEEEEGEADQAANFAIMQRLKTADDRTRQMTREEYVHWSECRQASFTFRKAKRFREWAGVNYVTDSKPQDDIIDILGFLTFEIVANLTEEALKVRDAEEKLRLRNGSKNSIKRSTVHHLFDGPEEEQKPIMPCHIQEAYRRSQYIKPKNRALRRFNGGLIRMKTRYI